MGGLAGVGLGLAWWGLRRPAPFPAPVGPSRDMGTVPLPGDLPVPVLRYLRGVLPDPSPRQTSAAVCGVGRIRIGPVWLPLRFRYSLLAGQAYRHEMEVVLWARRLLRAHEQFRQGHARLELPFGTVADSRQVDSAANVALWGEMVWLPAVFVTDRRVRWQDVGQGKAALIVPSPEGEDRLEFAFDAESGLPTAVEALRYRRPKDSAKAPWRVEFQAWGTFRGVRAPSRLSVRWLDEAGPWLRVEVHSVSHNVDIPGLD